MAINRLVVLLPLLLAACGSDPAPDNAAANSAAVVKLPEGPKLAGVRLWHPVRASGTRPFWAMEIAPGRITFTDFEGKGEGGGKVTDLYPADPKLARDSATYTTQTPAGERVTATLTAETCLEGGKPVIEQPLKAEVNIGARVLTGCARQVPAGEIGAAAMGNGTEAR
ncbi:hypothetical protein AB2M62_11320 [Sphingomonas sp. MMS12-HWE2-04]|uniref:hypothetical protein n=1 Tax=Sphingomonas sp. MMS12-HWE2-04 TaxID=3234199 RepID=UPI00384DF1DD